MIKQKTLFRLHLWLGLASGVFMFIIGLSGAVAVFVEEIDWLVTPALRARATPGQPRASADAVLASVRAAYPADRVNVLNLSGRPSFAHVAKVQSKTRGNLDVFIDPTTARINGDRTYSSAYTSTLRNFIRQLHLRLFMGLWGRVFVGVFGVTLALSCVTGLWIYRGWLKNLFRLRWRSVGLRTRWSDLHKFVGVWSLLFNLMIGVTGAVFGLENLTGQVRSKWLRPPAKADPADETTPTRPRAPRPIPPSSEPLTLEALLARGRKVFPDLAVRSIQFPANATAPIVLRGDVPDPLVQQSHVRRANALALDPHTGGVRQLIDGRAVRGWSRLYSSFDPLHFGYFGGTTTKIIWFILGLTPSALAFSGTWLWWRRTRGRPAPASSNLKFQISNLKSQIPPSSPRPQDLVPVAAVSDFKSQIPPASTAAASSSVRFIALAATAFTLAGAYLLVARAQENWSVTGRLIEHAIAKPVSIALVAFPVTGLLGWLAWRNLAHRLRFAACTGLCVAWYLVLVTLFQ